MTTIRQKRMLNGSRKGEKMIERCQTPAGETQQPDHSSAPASKNIDKGVFEKYFEKKGLKGGNSLKDL